MSIENITLEEFKEAVAKRPKRRAAKAWLTGDRETSKDTLQADMHYLDDRLAVFRDGSVLFNGEEIFMRPGMFSVLRELTGMPNEYFSLIELAVSISGDDLKYDVVKAWIYLIRRIFGDSDRTVIRNAHNWGYVYLPQGQVHVARERRGLYPNYKDDSLEIFVNGTAVVNGEKKWLRRKEYLLLCALLHKPGNTVEKPRLLELVYDADVELLKDPDNSLIMLVHGLNTKLSRSGKSAIIFSTGWYTFQPDGVPSVNKYASAN